MASPAVLTQDDGQDITPVQDTQETAAPENEYGPNMENLPKEIQGALVDLARKFTEEDRYSRRLEIQECRRARFYWRGMQHLYWDYKSEGWNIMGPGGGSLTSTASDQDSSVLYVTNIYQAFGLSLEAVLTQNLPSVRFEPEDAQDAADVETAKAANDARKIIEHQNDAVMLMVQLAYLAWTDGRIGGYSRWKVDKRTAKPRLHITQAGALELKVPITTECMEDYVYLQWSDEYHVAIMKREIKEMEFPDDYTDKIKGGAQGNGQDVYERTARISVKQGVSLLTQSGDTLSHLVTYQRTWMRPAAFEMLKERAVKDQLAELFPDGCYVGVMNGVYAGARNESMDDHWAICHALPGDGQFRNAMGYSMLSVQERFNDIVNIAQDVYEKTIPAAYADDELFDGDAWETQWSTSGAHYSVSKPADGRPLADHFYYEPPATVSADMLQYAQELMGPLAQFLTGAFPALFGGQMSDQKTASGYAMARDQAMGRIGLIWRAIKRYWARIMEQAVRITAQYSQDDLMMGVPDEHGNVQTTQVRIEDLQGSIFCFPDTDENFPESFTQKRSAYMQLVQMAGQNPALESMLLDPENLELGRKMIGLEEFEIPGADAAKKQLAEINIMLTSVPIPNPQFAQLQGQLQQMSARSQAGGLHPDGSVEMLAQQLQSTPQMNPSVPIDPDFDDNAAELKTGTDWINSAEGQKQKKENPQGFMNVRLHLLAHKQVLQAQAAAMVPPPAPPAAHPAPPKPVAKAA